MKFIGSKSQYIYTVPNGQGGTFLSYNTTTKEVTHRTGAQLISDLGLATTTMITTKEDAWVISPRDFTNGTLITTNIDYSQSQGAAWLLEIKGNMYGGGLPISAMIQGYIYTDTIINAKGFTTNPTFTDITALNLGGKLCFWFHIVAYLEGFSARISDVTTSGTQGIPNQVLSIENVADPGGTKRVNIPIESIATFPGILNYLPSYNNWQANPVITNRKVIGELTWRNYGNWHTIFDASSGFSPDGTQISRSDAEVVWRTQYPSLMGWSGIKTYEVRVGSARNADKLGEISSSGFFQVDRTFGINNGSDSRINKSWFDYNWAGTGRPGMVISFSGLNNDYKAELFVQFNGTGMDIGYRSRNGDTQEWNPPRWLWHEGHFTATDILNWKNAFDNKITDLTFESSDQGDHYRLVRQNGTITERLKIGIAVIDTRVMNNGLGSDGSNTFLPKSTNLNLDHKLLPLFHFGADGWRGELIMKAWHNNYRAWKISGPGDNGEAEKDYFLSATSAITGEWGIERKILTDRHISDTDISNWNNTIKDEIGFEFLEREIVIDSTSPAPTDITSVQYRNINVIFTGNGGNLHTVQISTYLAGQQYTFSNLDPDKKTLRIEILQGGIFTLADTVDYHITNIYKVWGPDNKILRISSLAEIIEVT